MATSSSSSIEEKKTAPITTVQIKYPKMRLYQRTEPFIILEEADHTPDGFFAMKAVVDFKERFEADLKAYWVGVGEHMIRLHATFFASSVVFDEWLRTEMKGHRDYLEKVTRDMMEQQRLLHGTELGEVATKNVAYAMMSGWIAAQTIRDKEEWCIEREQQYQEQKTSVMGIIRSYFINIGAELCELSPIFLGIVCDDWVDILTVGCFDDTRATASRVVRSWLLTRTWPQGSTEEEKDDITRRRVLQVMRILITKFDDIETAAKALLTEYQDLPDLEEEKKSSTQLSEEWQPEPQQVD